jgi:FMN hydrolase / 5-amino-6-(5-phospho-D-ribitylamino)uracil phosphatase
MHRIRAICFDLDNTLWDVWPVIVRAEQAMYEFLAARYPRLTAQYSLDALRAERENAVAAEPHRQHDFSYLRVAVLRRCARQVGYPEALAEEAFAVFIAARNVVSLYSDVLPALQTLTTRYPLLTLSNGNADLKTIGIDRYFVASFAAREVGALKPDPIAFRHVLRHLQLAPEQVLYVGDDPHADVQGARSVGMQAVWVNRDGALWRSEFGIPPPAVATLDGLLSLLPATLA